MTGGYDVVKAAGGRTALTFYACDDLGDQNEMFAWANANVPERMRTGLDYVLLSYYDGDCGNLRSDWQAVFDKLRTLFPNAALGFGEVGSVNLGVDNEDPAAAAPFIARYYGMPITTPGYIGGCFWWYFAEDMVPMDKGMYPMLRQAIAAMP
jgi:hypothetical protein